MSVPLQKSSIKALARHLRDELGLDTETGRKVHDAIAHGLGYKSYGALKAHLEASTATPVPHLAAEPVVTVDQALACLEREEEIAISTVGTGEVAAHIFNNEDAEDGPTDNQYDRAYDWMQENRGELEAAMHLACQRVLEELIQDRPPETPSSAPNLQRFRNGPPSHYVLIRVFETARKHLMAPTGPGAGDRIIPVIADSDEEALLLGEWAFKLRMRMPDPENYALQIGLIERDAALQRPHAIMAGGTVIGFQFADADGLCVNDEGEAAAIWDLADYEVLSGAAVETAFIWTARDGAVSLQEVHPGDIQQAAFVTEIAPHDPRTPIGVQLLRPDGTVVHGTPEDPLGLPEGAVLSGPAIEAAREIVRRRRTFVAAPVYPGEVAAPRTISNAGDLAELRNILPDWLQDRRS
ncbi:hypothetical protein CKO28_00655 [Rhodovibrio sodomensis]|uniref:Uncharacterized protein n=1 Tax=Rhodovibrio sodomensis TaxID=1088 RepID=A0ABS1D9A1_9PROT|nr:hypothetical protein [Rhodovibrio sodomensis]MBK1666551.1 hypothetical protein [Rhodovibrio sodomensis]